MDQLDRKRSMLSRCEDWQSFDDVLQRINSDSSAEGRGTVRVVFRGHSFSSWSLKSNWERRYFNVQRAGLLERDKLNRGALMKEYEDSLYAHLDTYKRLVAEHVGRLPRYSEDGWWALGRHHGLWTPLLDWTQDPYVAAFFAVYDSGDDRNSATVWALELRPQVLSDADSFSVVEVPSARHRSKSAQRVLYTKLTHATLTDVEGFLSNAVAANSLWRIELPRSQRSAGLKIMDEHGINPNSLLLDEPDQAFYFERAAAQANQILRSQRDRRSIFNTLI